MERITLGKTELKVSPICLGGGSYGGSVKEPQAREQLDHLRELGGNFVDTAVIYCDWFEGERSSSQNMIGRWLKDRKCRHEMVLSVKGCNGKVIRPTNSLATAPRTPRRLHRADIIEDIELSLKNLGTDYLDIFTLHHDNEEVEIEEILETLEEQKKRGVIRAYGCSNWRIARQEQARAYAQAKSLSGFMVDQINWCLNVFAPAASGNKNNPVMDAEAYKFHRQTKIPVMAYGANGRGYFHRVANKMPLREQDYTEYDCPQNRAILEILKDAAEQTGAQINSIVLHYLMMDHGFQTIPIIGVKSIQELDMGMESLNVKLPKETEEALCRLKGLESD